MDVLFPCVRTVILLPCVITVILENQTDSSLKCLLVDLRLEIIPGEVNQNNDSKTYLTVILELLPLDRLPLPPPPPRANCVEVFALRPQKP